MEEPIRHLGQLDADYPRLREMTRHFLGRQGKELAWPSWCFLPMAADIAMIKEHGRSLDQSEWIDISRMAAVNAWRYGQGIYEFNGALIDALAASEIHGSIPSDVFTTRLPRWSSWVALPAVSGATGFYVHLEHDARTERAELRFLVASDGGDFLPLILHIGDWTLTEAVVRFVEEADLQAASHGFVGAFEAGPLAAGIVETVELLVSIALYLCSDNADMQTFDQAPRGVWTGVEPPVPVRPTVWMVGDSLSIPEGATGVWTVRRDRRGAPVPQWSLAP